MQHEEGTIITGRANILENVIKAGHVQAFYGRHSQAILSPSLDMSFLMLVVAQMVRRMQRLRWTPRQATVTRYLRIVNVVSLLICTNESIIHMDSRYKNMGGYDIHALNPPPVYPLAGRVTVLSLDDDGGGQAATVLVTVNDKANEEYCA